MFCVLHTANYELITVAMSNVRSPPVPRMRLIHQSNGKWTETKTAPQPTPTHMHTQAIKASEQTKKHIVQIAFMTFQCALDDVSVKYLSNSLRIQWISSLSVRCAAAPFAASTTTTTPPQFTWLPRQNELYKIPHQKEMALAAHQQLGMEIMIYFFCIVFIDCLRRGRLSSK